MKPAGAMLLLCFTFAIFDAVLASHGTINAPFDEPPSAFDTEALLKLAKQTQDSIANLTAKIKDLQAQISTSDLQTRTGNLIDRLAIANDNLISTNSSVKSLQAASVSSNFTAKLELFDGIFKCFAASKCVGERTTPTTTTTTTASPTKCEGKSLTSKNSSQTLDSPSSGMVSNYDCSDSIHADLGYHIVLDITLIITGRASLRFVNLDNNKQVGQIYNESSNAKLLTDARNLQIQEYAGSLANDGIKYSIEYTSVDACFKRDCVQGVCMVQPDNSPLCVCNKCVVPDSTGKCTKAKDPCIGMGDRCGSGTCVTKPDDPKCTYGCVCPGMQGYQMFCPS